MSKLFSRFTELRRDPGGAVAVIFALSLLPIILCIGSAIDYAAAVAARARLQSALDAAVLATATNDALVDGTESALAANMASWLAANTPSAQVGELSVSLVSGTLTASASQQVDTSFLRILGIDAVPISAKSVARASAASTIEVVLAIDTTLSMNKTVPGDSMSKFEGAKAAANILIDKLFAKAAKGAKVKIGLVPFDWHIRIPLSYRNSWWLTDAQDYTYTSPGYCTKPMVSWSSTVTSTYVYNCGVDGEYKECTGTSTVYIDPVYGPEVCFGDSTNTTYWTGCVGSRLTSWDTTKVTTDDPEHGILGSDYCRNEFVRLSDTPGPLKTAISNLTLGHETYIPAALMWSWRLLAAPAPTEAFGDGSPPGPEVKKYVVLLSDGANSVGPSGYAHNYIGNNPTTGDGVPTADKRMQTLCDQLKANGIQIFTVAFDLDTDKPNELLKSCASGPPYYYRSNTTSELTDAFSAIGSYVGATRLVN